MKAYEVTRCNVDGFRIWSGVVVDAEEKGVIEAIKNKFGLEYLYCEKFPDTNLEKAGRKQFDYSETPVEAVLLQNLTVGELLGILRYSIGISQTADAEAKKANG